MKKFFKALFMKETWSEFFDESTPYVLRNLLVAVACMAFVVWVLYVIVNN